jgi:hypothetical protein
MGCLDQTGWLRQKALEQRAGRSLLPSEEVSQKA